MSPVLQYETIFSVKLAQAPMPLRVKSCGNQSAMNCGLLSEDALTPSVVLVPLAKGSDLLKLGSPKMAMATTAIVSPIHASTFSCVWLSTHHP